MDFNRFANYRMGFWKYWPYYKLAYDINLLAYGAFVYKGRVFARRIGVVAGDGRPVSVVNADPD